MLEKLEDQDLAATLLQESVRLNRLWGASAKVEKLQEAHKSLLVGIT